MLLKIEEEGSTNFQKKWLNKKWPLEVAQKAVFYAGAFMEDRGIENLESRTYTGTKYWKLNGWLKNGWRQKVSDGGLSIKVISNPQFAGADFNYGPANDTGHKEIRPVKAKILAAPVSRFNVGMVPAKLLSKDKKWVIFGKRVKATKGNHYFQDAIKATKENRKSFLEKAYKNFKPK
jgi:hypothetical protein